MRIEIFLEQLISLLDQKKVSNCVLRNYKGLPYSNIGNDIDFLIHYTQLKNVKKVFLLLEGVAVTGFLERPQVISFFIYGVEWGDGKKTIQIDFIFAFTWKGLSYLDVDQVLNAAVSGKCAESWIRTPIPEHEAIICFFSSYLIGGWIKERYQEFVKSVFIRKKHEIEEILSNVFGLRLSREIINSVILGNYPKLLQILVRLRLKFFSHSFERAPWISAKCLIKHFTSEIYIRYTYRPIMAICILGPDGAGKSSTIDELKSGLQGSAKEIYSSHLKPVIFKKRQNQRPVTNPHAQQSRSKIISLIKVWIWALELYIDQVTHGKKNLSLRIWDRYYHDLLVDPKRYRYGGPMWVARLIGRVIPKPDLWILLDVPPEVVQKRKQEVSLTETRRQCNEYRKLIGGMKNCLIIEGSRSFEEVARDVCEGTLHFLAKRTEIQLGIDTR